MLWKQKKLRADNPRFDFLAPVAMTSNGDGGMRVLGSKIRTLRHQWITAFRKVGAVLY